MSSKLNIREWLHIRANNQRIAMLMGMKRQFSKLPEGDPRTALIQARIDKLESSIDWGDVPKKEVSDGSDDQ